MNEIQWKRVEELTLHPEALATPRMVDEQFEALKLSIEQQGQIEPVVTYRNRIVDGRHRWLILQELGIETIKYVAMPNNSTLVDIQQLVQGKEVRRHESASQLAISAWNYMSKSKTKVTQTVAAKKYGASVNRIGEAKKIAVTYNRPDILELIFDGGKFNTGTDINPFPTDSLGTILKWLSENGTVAGAVQKVAVAPRTELTDDEQVIVNSYVNSITKESVLVQEEINRLIYFSMKDED